MIIAIMCVVLVIYDLFVFIGFLDLQDRVKELEQLNKKEGK